MSSHANPYRSAGLRTRLAALALALTFAASAFSAVVLTFQGASPVRWLTPTPELMELVADCERQGGRATRDRCKQSVVASRLAPEPSAVRVVQR
jgi:hypothetical protein